MVSNSEDHEDSASALGTEEAASSKKSRLARASMQCPIAVFTVGDVWEETVEQHHGCEILCEMCVEQDVRTSMTAALRLDQTGRVVLRFERASRTLE